MVLTIDQLEEIDALEEDCGVKDFPKSKYWLVGHDFLHNGHPKLAVDSFKRGAEIDGCVSCILFFITHQF